MAKRTKRPEWLSVSIAALRKASRWWRPAQEAEREATVDRGMRQCNLCKDIVHYKQAAKDHIKPVVPVTGWVSLDDFAEKLFVGKEGWQMLCDSCHSKKTAAENELRRKYKKEKLSGNKRDTKKVKRITRKFKSQRRKQGDNKGL